MSQSDAFLKSSKESKHYSTVYFFLQLAKLLTVLGWRIYLEGCIRNTKNAYKTGWATLFLMANFNLREQANVITDSSSSPVTMVCHIQAAKQMLLYNKWRFQKYCLVQCFKTGPEKRRLRTILRVSGERLDRIWTSVRIELFSRNYDFLAPKYSSAFSTITHDLSMLQPTRIKIKQDLLQFYTTVLLLTSFRLYTVWGYSNYLLLDYKGMLKINWVEWEHYRHYISVD